MFSFEKVITNFFIMIICCLFNAYHDNDNITPLTMRCLFSVPETYLVTKCGSLS